MLCTREKLVTRKPCLTPGCPEYATSSRSRCRVCQRQRRRETYDHPDYRKLPRPRGRCTLQIKCDGAPATTWDHTVPTSKGGTHLRSNLQPACASCNSAKRDRLT
ncbi:hypothetical protein CYL16_01170 [Mycobacterium sp. EPG1]|nr:hypothetical protein CYL16_01170 [Mycobacterium sp. EPG1]